MTKMDALNQQTLMRCFRALRDYEIGLLDVSQMPERLSHIQIDYLEKMINIMEEVVDE